jgi:hypothetical protein
MLILNNFTLLVEGLYFSLVVWTIFVFSQLVIKIIIILADDIKKDLKKNHDSTMAAQSTNLANDLQTNELAKLLIKDNEEIKEQLKDIQNSLKAINYNKND